MNERENPPDRREQLLDEMLVRRAQGGEREAFEELIGRWQERLWRHARFLTGHDDAAWDVLQETWIALVQGLRKLHDASRFRAWAYRVVSFKCADWHRGQTRRRRTAEQAPEPPPQPSMAGAIDAATDLGQAMGRLSGEHRAILGLRYLEDFDLTEIAGILDIPVGTVKSRLHYAKQQLRKILERSPP